MAMKYPNTTLELMVCSLRANGAAAHLQGHASKGCKPCVCKYR